MKKFLLAGVGLVALGVTAASAADIPRRHAPPAQAPVYVVPPFSWTGAYVGLYGGGGWGSSEFTAPLPSSSFRTSGALVGGTLGYNYQVGQTVLGIEADGGWSNVRGSAACGGTTCGIRNNWLATVRGRLGYAAGGFMPYITGGAAFGDVKTTVTGFGDTHDTKAGWTVGGGIEAALVGPWSAKLEYLYVDLGEVDTALGATAKYRTNIVRAGLNYRF